MSGFEAEVHVIQKMAIDMGEDFDSPDDDWQGFVVMVMDDGQVIMPILFANEAEKSLIATEIIPAAVRMTKPWFVGQLQSAWMVTRQKPENMTVEEAIRESQRMGEPSPSKHPDREEALILVGVTIDQIQMWTAKITRFPDKPPKLDPWELVMGRHDGDLTGMFVSPIVEAMKTNADLS